MAQTRALGLLAGWLAGCLPAFPHFGHIINSGGKARNKRECQKPKMHLLQIPARIRPLGESCYEFVSLSHPKYVHQSTRSLALNVVPVPGGHSMPLKLHPLPEPSALFCFCSAAFAQCRSSPVATRYLFPKEQVETSSGKERRLGKRMEEIGEG